MERRASSRVQARSQRPSLCPGWVAGWWGDTLSSRSCCLMASHRSFTAFWSKTMQS